MNEKTKTLIISFLIMAAGMAVNFTARAMGRPMPLSYTIYGGEIIQEIAKAGNDCIIVGRDADVILQDYHPFRVFVCADLAARTRRCMNHEEKKPASERLTEKEVLRNIRRIDKSRARTREILTGKSRGDASTFDLTVNATYWEVKKLVPAVADFAMRWFEAQ